MVPKYFKNLHLSICIITGTPRIVNIDFDKTNCSDKYKDIDKDEWEGALLSYFEYFTPNTSQMMIGGNDWNFVLGGNFDSKEKLIQCLKNRIKQIEELDEN